MIYLQSSLEEIIDSERQMLLDAPARYGKYYHHARNATIYLSLCVETIEHDRADMFGRLHALMKKHHTLAFFSALRLHKVQAMMNLRQVLEAGAAAAFAIAHPEQAHFVYTDEHGILDPSPKLTNKRYRWLNDSYPKQSKWIKDTKDQLNSQVSHANVIIGDNTFSMSDDGTTAATPFFDKEDDFFVIADLWLISRVAIILMDFLFGVARDVGKAGRQVVEFRSDFQRTVPGLCAESNALLAECMASDRYEAIAAKEAARRKVSQTPLQKHSRKKGMSSSDRLGAGATVGAGSGGLRSRCFEIRKLWKAAASCSASSP